ncbi:hypothetical protein K469DRAFT_47275 [Zopfia rhizophila CBS 207.26]|uniref:C2H2-type domain-containing protein n=1 Tax=Zopfia rhizophila CBS 207.26 TaxID=1314779 RepID=A0A6A6ECM2_9PEZI|nr:hypothetical protein K469DRAFT_47275 [Zopfia rhizophila CBS 207.26]
MDGYDNAPPDYSSPSSAVWRQLWPQGECPFNEVQSQAASGTTTVDITQAQDGHTLCFIDTNGTALASQDPQSIQCQFCNQKFTGLYGKGNLTRHRRLKHFAIDEASMGFKCTLCDKTYKRKDARKKHEWKKHGHGPRPKKRLERTRTDLGVYELQA